MSTAVEPTLLLATTNLGKREELARLLPASIRILSLVDLGMDVAPETGTTFTDNASRKALGAADQTGLLSLADDSGLEVEALNGAPGVRSARFAGEGGSAQQNRNALLVALVGVPSQYRAARFVCVVALARPGTVIALARGTCEGTIADIPRGSQGFGYDSLFLLPDGRSMAELETKEKNRISHRAVAYRRLLPALMAEIGIIMDMGGHR